MPQIREFQMAFQRLEFEELKLWYMNLRESDILQTRISQILDIEQTLIVSGDKRSIQLQVFSAS